MSEMASAVPRRRKANYEIDMIHGPMLRKVLVFSLPLMLSGVLQLLFNAADIIVVGRFTGPEAIAAVGSTTALVNLMISLFVGLSVGANVLVAQYYGAGDQKNCRETVRAAVLLSVVAGILLSVMGFYLSHPMLKLMGTPENVIRLSTVYLQIFFLGMPVLMLYNFGSAVLRGVGDTRRPLIYLMIAGVLNVVLNLTFVILFGMGVAGVALATILSQAVSAGLVLRCLIVYDGMVRLTLRDREEERQGFFSDVRRAALETFHYHPEKLLSIFRNGLPAGVQTALFSVSNVIIQSSVNSFGSVVMAGNAAAQNLEGFVYLSMNALMQAAITFTSANYGARDKKRVTRVMLICMGVVSVIGLALGQGVYRFGGPLLSVYTTDAETISYGVIRLSVISATYFLCGLMDTSTGCLRGIGYAFLSMMISLIGSCVLRIIWVATVFQATPTLFILYLSYPISWILTAAVQIGCFLFMKKRAFARLQSVEPDAPVSPAEGTCNEKRA